MIIDITVGQFRDRAQVTGGNAPIQDVDLAFTPFIRGPRGPAGSGIEGGSKGQVLAKASDDEEDFDWIEVFHTSQRFAELDTPQKKHDARVNLDLQNIDGGTFF